MMNRIYSRVSGGILALLALIMLCSMAFVAQTTQTKPSEAKPKPTRPADEEALNKAAWIKDPQERTEALIKYVNDFPRAVFIRNAVFYLMRPLKEFNSEPEKIRTIVNRFVEGTASAPAYARCEFYSGISKNLLNSGLLLDLAEDLSRKGVALLNEKEYVENERRIHEQRQEYLRAEDAKRTPEFFPKAAAVEKFRVFSATLHATLGNALLKQGKTEEAEKTFKQALKIEPVMETMTGLADIAEKRGDKRMSFDYLTMAALTGRLNKTGQEKLAALYRSLHPENPQGLSDYLDAKYREKPHTSLHVDSYKPTASRSDRVVLAELATGADCEPCVSVDQSFDAELERYSRDDLILLVYHMHAPNTDPLVSLAADTRHKFYDMHGTPTVVIDGKNLNPGDGPRTESNRVFKKLDAAIASRLEKPAEAKISLKTALEGGKVRIAASVDQVKSTSANLKLHIMLVENEVSYSGSNGIRFHPMVVRAMVSPGGVGGFNVDPSKPMAVEHTFDLNNVTVELKKYMADYLIDISKRIGSTVEAKEDKSALNPNRLSVVAFVQDAITHEVLQAVYSPVSAADKSVAGK